MMRDRKIRIWISSLLLSACLLAGCGAAGGAETAGGGHGTLLQTGDLTSVHFIDVGQGDSILIESAGHAMLVDAGENDQADAVEAYLRKRDVKKLDYVIGTHPHSDHIGGLDVVIRAFEVGKVLLPPVEHTTRTFEDVLDAVAQKEMKITKPVAGDTYELGAASFEIIAPCRDYGSDLNNWSIGIRLTHGGRSFVLTGDAEAGAENDICANGRDLSADVLKLGHHGSSTSTTEEFLNAVNPAAAVISCGKNNDYGHPHKETMELMEEYGIAVYRTDEMGTVIVTTDGENLSWETERGNGPEGSRRTENDRAGSDPAGSRRTENDRAGSDPAGNSRSEESGAAEAVYVVNTNTGVFHRPDCSSVSKMKPKNKETVTSGREEVISRGYSPCGSCKP